MRPKRAKRIGAGFIVIGCLATAQTASAHHSYATFDNTRTITIDGTVRSVEWANPHIAIVIYVPNGKGGNDLWTVEGGTPGRLERIGWNRNSLNPGDKVTIEANPRQDGSAGAFLIKVTRADGEVLRDHAVGDPRTHDKAPS